MANKHGEDERSRLLGLLSTQTSEQGDSLLLRTREVAVLFQVSERAVTEWARRGRIASVRTPGGHRRYRADEVRRLLGMRPGHRS